MTDTSKPTADVDASTPDHVDSVERLPPGGIPNHIASSVIAMLVLFPPTGVAAIAMGMRVERHLRRGDIRRARAASTHAYRWLIATWVLGAIAWIASTVLYARSIADG